MCDNPDDYIDENHLEFWNIELGANPYPAARGILYAKPTPSTVSARITFPRLEPAPRFQVNDKTRLTALCANRKWMRKIPAEVKAITRNPDGSQVYELLLRRKGSASPQ